MFNPVICELTDENPWIDLSHWGKCRALHQVLYAPQYQPHHLFLGLPSGFRGYAAGWRNALGEEEPFSTSSHTHITPKSLSLNFSKALGLGAKKADSTFLR